MSTRIGTLGAEQLYLSRLDAIQTRMQNEQSEVTTGLKATSYSGIASEAGDAINFSNEATQANQYLADNALANTKLDATATTLTSIQTSINNLLNQLNDYAQGDTTDPTQIQSLQESAMNSMVDLSSYLGTNIGGQYLFSGGRVSTPPVDLPATTLSQFQAMYNGSTTTFPTTRAGDLADFDLTSTQTGAVDFDASNGLIIPANAGSYSTVPSSAYVAIAGSNSNNGDYTITGHAATSTGGTMLSETSDIGNATITYDGGTKTLTTGVGNDTGAVALSFDSAGQIVMTPAATNSLVGLAAVGSTFTISGSNSDIADATGASPLQVGTNLYTYASGATSPTGITLSATDTLTITNTSTEQAYTYHVGSDGPPTLAGLANWLTTTTTNGVVASVTGQGQLSVQNNGGGNYSLSGSLVGLLGLSPATLPTSLSPPSVSSTLYTSANAQTLTSLQAGNGTPLVQAGDALTFQVGAAAATTFPVTATSTLTDLTSWIQQQDPDATVSLAGGTLSITNGNGAATGYTLGGSLTTELGLPTTIAGGGTGTAALPVVPGAYDGAYQVVAYNSNGSVVLANDTTPTTAETVSAGSIGLLNGTPPAGTAVSTDVTSGNVTFALTGSTDQTLTSLQTGSGASLISVGDTLTIGADTLTVTPTTTLTDVTRFVQQSAPDATASFANGQLQITNDDSAPLTLGGTLVPKLGLGTAPDVIGPNGTQTGTPLPVTPADTVTMTLPATDPGTQPLTSLVTRGGVPLASVGDSLTIGAHTLTVTTSTTPNDVATWIQQEAPNTTASFTNGQFQITNNDPMNTLTLSGSLVPELGLGASAANTDFIAPNTDTIPAGTSLTGTALQINPAQQFAAGDSITISGTTGHNGTYTVSGVTANTVSFQINPDALRVSQLVQQTGRTDDTMTFDTTAADTTAGSTTNPVPGTVASGLATLDSSVFGGLNFSPSGTGGETISANIPGSLETTAGVPYPPAGTVITLKSTSGVNDGSYTVVSNDGTNLIVQGTTLTAEAGTTTSSMSATSWYKGDTLSLQQSIDSNRQVDTSIFASDPAFEKAMRAMGILAEGAAGTAGGLANHPERIAAAQYLLNQAIQSTSGGTPPYGTEETSNVTQLIESVGYTQNVIKTADTKNTAYVGFIDTQVANIEGADQTVAITTLLADSNALQASYQALARVSQLSLLNYLPNP